MTKKILICILLTSLVTPLHARLTEPGNRDPEDGMTKVNPKDVEAEKARLAALYEERTKNAERELYRNAINVLVKESLELKTFASSDFKNEYTKQITLGRLKNDQKSLKDFVSMPRIDGDFNQMRVFNLKEKLSSEVKSSIMSFYLAEINYQEEKLFNSLK